MQASSSRQYNRVRSGKATYGEIQGIYYQHKFTAETLRSKLDTLNGLRRSMSKKEFKSEQDRLKKLIKASETIISACKRQMSLFDKKSFGQ